MVTYFKNSRFCWTNSRFRRSNSRFCRFLFFLTKNFRFLAKIFSTSGILDFVYRILNFVGRVLDFVGRILWFLRGVFTLPGVWSALFFLSISYPLLIEKIFSKQKLVQWIRNPVRNLKIIFLFFRILKEE